MQTRPYDCGVSVSQNISQQLDGDLTFNPTAENGTTVDQMIAYNAKHNGGPGLSPGDVRDILQNNFPDSTVNAGYVTNANFIKNFLNQEKGVAVLINTPQGGHWVQVLSLGEHQGIQTVRIYDPAVGTFSVGLDDFVSRIPKGPLRDSNAVTIH